MTKLSATFLAIGLEGNIASIVVGTIAGSAILEALVYFVILFGNRVIYHRYDAEHVFGVLSNVTQADICSHMAGPQC